MNNNTEESLLKKHNIKKTMISGTVILETTTGSRESQIFAFHKELDKIQKKSKGIRGGYQK